jgi:uncharacterized membrane protein
MKSASNQYGAFRAERHPMSFILYVFGFVVLLAGVGYGAYLLNVPEAWIVVGSLVIVGAGIMSSGSHIKRYFYPGEPPNTR